ncbi:MAG TPA: hypothetical protein VFN35_29155 [Ktedonobacteraceae bacterium]|nr:hypothetical protein [Ktedonobacteraceae bacterium]
MVVQKPSVASAGLFPLLQDCVVSPCDLRALATARVRQRLSFRAHILSLRGSKTGSRQTLLGQHACYYRGVDIPFCQSEP